MEEFDLFSRVDEKPVDCGKRVSYSEFIYGNQYYMLYNKQLHKVELIGLTNNASTTELIVKYLDNEEVYLGEKQDEYYVVDLAKYMPVLYGLK